MTATTTLQARLTAVILGDPDVHIIYPTQSTLRKIGGRVADTLKGQETQPPTVIVTETNVGTTVTVSVGVTGERPATAVCRNLHDQIASELAAASVKLPATISVKIASIS
ncbi:hypothetical protein [Gryllotalpicola protaetiae]|uniref:Uncharacterized protein n=1 Tax=Gryllotalpicola protaetiae TaxID=2419771 RepID=A0A387BQ31_9MICO|nr:hypothetical protein [Gryllotalpicola protaetiae]AYG03137.1 hypothetical protein D7I44_06080 [Gryllotalpicola protaetiae]